jgi:RNA polymerase sigma-70 factor (ECF subfamily)
MAKINLRDYYPYYNVDLFVDVPDEVAVAMAEAERLERNYIRRLIYNKAFYSLDAGDGIEQEAISRTLSPCEVYERKMTMEQIYAALKALPDKQGRRIYAHYILGIPQTEIARAEGVSVAAISGAIERGLKNMEIILKKLSVPIKKPRPNRQG